MKLSLFARLGFWMVVLFSALSPFGRAQVVLSNLSETPFSESPLATNFWFGSRFVTGGSESIVNSVVLALGDASDTSGNLAVWIAHDDGGAPGGVLETLAGNANPATSGNYSYTSTGLALEANTSYWLVAGVTSGAGSYSWSMTDSTGFNSFLSGWSIPPEGTHNYTFDQGANWEATGSAGDGFPRQFSISVSAIPEPSTYALIAGVAGLGLAAWRRRRA